MKKHRISVAESLVGKEYLAQAKIQSSKLRSTYTNLLYDIARNLLIAHGNLDPSNSQIAIIAGELKY
jgi:hypothetical protein